MVAGAMRCEALTSRGAILLLCLAGALVACSGQESAPAADQANGTSIPANTSVAPPDDPSQIPLAQSASNQRGQAMTGNVSSLNADITDLVVRVTDQATIIDIPADVLFEFDKASLSQAAQAPLARLLSYVQAGGDGAIVVTGHTDAKGDDAYNLTLSRKRAQAVADWLASQGTTTSRLTVVGKGEAEPVATNTRPDGADDPAGRAKNRRVSVSIPR